MSIARLHELIAALALRRTDSHITCATNQLGHSIQGEGSGESQKVATAAAASALVEQLEPLYNEMQARKREEKERTKKDANSAFALDFVEVVTLECGTPQVTGNVHIFVDHVNGALLGDGVESLHLGLDSEGHKTGKAKYMQLSTEKMAVVFFVDSSTVAAVKPLFENKKIIFIVCGLQGEMPKLPDDCVQGQFVDLQLLAGTRMTGAGTPSLVAICGHLYCGGREVKKFANVAADISKHKWDIFERPPPLPYTLLLYAAMDAFFNLVAYREFTTRRVTTATTSTITTTTTSTLPSTITSTITTSTITSTTTSTITTSTPTSTPPPHPASALSPRHPPPSCPDPRPGAAASSRPSWPRHLPPA
jgi:hypothetical protein